MLSDHLFLPPHWECGSSTLWCTYTSLQFATLIPTLLLPYINRPVCFSALYAIANVITWCSRTIFISYQRLSMSRFLNFQTNLECHETVFAFRRSHHVKSASTTTHSFLFNIMNFETYSQSSSYSVAIQRHYPRITCHLSSNKRTQWC